MNKKFVYGLMFGAAFVFASCGGGEKPAEEAPAADATTEEVKEDVSDYDPNRGEGKFDENNLQITGFDAAMAKKGEAAATTKCYSCHKMTDERLVGPGWKDLTKRRTPHWIMNFITNPDAMIDKDPALQEQLELCMVRMPNQNLADQEARDILEYMRQIDGAK